MAEFPEKGTFAYRDGTAILQLFFFLIYLVAAIFLTLKNRAGKDGTWYIYITFSLLRIIGSGFQFATINHRQYEIVAGAVVCAAIGVAPLTMLNLGMVQRLNVFVKNRVHRFVFIMFTLSSIVGITLASYGGAQTKKSSGVYGTSNYSKAGTYLFAVQYLLLWVLFIYVCLQKTYIPRPEYPLILCTVLCTPFILTRLVYTFLIAYSHDSRFRTLGGDNNIYLGMSVLPEIIATGIGILTGFLLRKMPVVKDTRFDSGDSAEMENLNRHSQQSRRGVRDQY